MAAGGTTAPTGTAPTAPTGGTVSLACVAVVGKDNEPLYVRDVDASQLPAPSSAAAAPFRPAANPTAGAGEGEDADGRGGGPPSASDLPAAGAGEEDASSSLEIDFPQDASSPAAEAEENGAQNPAAADKEENGVADGDGDGGDDEDPFGFFIKSDLSPHESASLQHQFLVHAALDRFEEVTVGSAGAGGGGRGGAAGGGSGGKWRTPGATGKDAMWVGLLCPIEEYRVYGYLTSTSIKFMAVVEDSGGDESPTTVKDSDLKSLFASLHDLYVQYQLNPFSKLRSKITSKRFDEGVTRCARLFNQKYSPEDVSWM